MNSQNFKNWLGAGYETQHQHPIVMGILNLTPDSFSDGGKYNVPEQAYIKVLSMIEDGVDIIDIGAESSRPGASVISVEEECQRLTPVLKKLRQCFDICISVDTCKPMVMQLALDLGADMINDIWALQQKGAVEILQNYDAPICLMHQSQQHQSQPPINWQSEQAIWQNQINFFAQRIENLLEIGISRQRLILDPGIGFGKICQDNLKLIQGIDKLMQFNLPILLGVSRKSFIGNVLDKPVNERLFGGLAVTTYAYLHGVTIHRTHDVLATKETLAMTKAILETGFKS